MNHGYDEKKNMAGSRRSRRNPKMRDDSPNAASVLSAATSEGRYSEARKTRMTDDSGLSLEATAKIARAKRRRRIIAMIVAECLALTMIFSYGYAARKWSTMVDIPFDQNEVKPNADINVDTVERMKGYWTIAIFGVDDRGNVIDKNTHADVNMICSINMDTGEIKLVSVFRDSYLNISTDGSYNKLNQAYFNGGPQQAVSALNRNLDLNITHYVTFNWKTVAEGINILGGVDVELSEAEFRYINSFITETVKVTEIGSHHLKSAGMNHLDGVQAVAYARLRKMDTDYARTERQRKVVQLAFDKAKAADIGVLNNIAEVIFEDLATNIEMKDILHMAININKYHLGETVGFPMARGNAVMGRKGDVVVPQTLESNVKELHKFLYGDEDYVPTDTVRKISSKIAADSGMYSEGRYIDKVPTDNGVVQPTKQTNDETTKASESEDGTGSSGAGNSTGAGTETSPTRQTDANGNVILETDANGNIITNPTGTTGTTGATRPTGPDESSAETKPGSTAATSESRPGSTAGESSGTYPGSTGGETSAPYPGSNTETSAAYPGSNTETSAAYPGSNRETTASGGPGTSGTAGTSGAAPTAAGTNPTSGPGSSGSSGTAASPTPGSQNTEIPTIGGPGT